MKQIAIAVDQLLNALLFFLPGGCWADETFSARCWRMRAVRPFNWLQRTVDTLLFFDPAHCEMSYLSEQRRAQSPPEYRPQRGKNA